MKHGRSGYERHGCRCAICRAANAAKVAATRARRLARLRRSPSPETDPGHGTQGGYDAGCRCEACRLVRQSRYWRDEGGPRRHWWRDLVVDTYRHARDAWEARLESSCSLSWQPGLLGRERRRERRGGRREVTDFLADDPPVTLRDVLKGLSKSFSSEDLTLTQAVG